MKRCPQCGREYDNTMAFCLDDGAELLYGPASMDEPATAILSGSEAVVTGFPGGGSQTRSQVQTTDQTAIFPAGTGDIAAKPRLDKRLLAAPVLLAIIALSGFFGYRYFKPSGGGPINSI